MTNGLLIRADADRRIGVGHVMRSLAIAQAWLDAGRGPVWLASAALPDALADRWEAEGFSVLRIGRGEGELARVVSKTGPSWVVLDGYDLGLAHQEAMRRAGRRVLVVDDDGSASTYVADRVVDQNLFADARRYADRSPGTRLLLGPAYALLRRELRRDRAAISGARSETVDPRVLVSLGGADPAGLSELVLDALTDSGLRVTLVVGPANTRGDALAGVAARSSRVEVVRNASNMRDLMAGASLAIVGAGITCLELAHAGVPQIVVVTADNQRRVAEALVERGIARSLGAAADVTAAAVREVVDRLLGDAFERGSMAARAMALVDGHGAARVVAAMDG